MGDRHGYIGLLFLLVPAMLQATEGAATTRDQVLLLQRVLDNGCAEWVTRDGLMGSETRRAYQRCRKRVGLAPHDAPGAPDDVQALVDELWLRKRALILLHRLGYLSGYYELEDRGVIVETLEKMSREQEIRPPLALDAADLDVLEGWLREHPSRTSLAFSLRTLGLPLTGLEIYLQMFKKEQQLNVFARRRGFNEPFQRLGAFPVMASTFTYPSDGRGEDAGPKTVQGDGKVPEGCYRLTWLNEWSDFYLGFQVSYPHRGDRIRSDRWQHGRSTGGAIVLHGGAVTIGCIPVGDPAIEELFLLLSGNGASTHGYATLHIFPCRFDLRGNEEILRRYGALNPELGQFWNSLRPIYWYFEQYRRLPEITIDRHTGYYIAVLERRKPYVQRDALRTVEAGLRRTPTVRTDVPYPYSPAALDSITITPAGSRGERFLTFSVRLGLVAMDHAESPPQDVTGRLAEDPEALRRIGLNEGLMKSIVTVAVHRKTVDHFDGRIIHEIESEIRWALNSALFRKLFRVDGDNSLEILVQEVLFSDITIQ